MPPRTTSRGSALPLFPLLSPCPINRSLALTVRIAKRFSISTCIHGVSTRKRRCSPDDKNGLFLSCRPTPSPRPAVDFSVSFSSFASSTARLPGDLTNRLIRSSSQIPLFVHPARRDTTRCPSRSIYSRPTRFYFPPTTRLDRSRIRTIWPGVYIYYLLSISRSWNRITRAQRAAICVS